MASCLMPRAAAAGLVLAWLLAAALPVSGQTPAVLLPRALFGSDVPAALGLPAGTRVATWGDADEAMRRLRESKPALAALPPRAAAEAIAAGLLAPLAAGEHPDWLRLPADPEARFARPWLWTATGIAHDAYAPLPAPASLKQLWMPAYSEKVALPADPERVLPLTLMLLGWPPEEADAKRLKQTCDFLGRITRSAQTGASPAWRPLADGSATIGIFDASDAVLVDRDAALPRTAFDLPADGFLLQPLYLVVPSADSGAGQPLAAALLTPEIQARAADRLGFLPADPAALPLLPQDLASSPLASLPSETLAKGRIVVPSQDALQRWRACWRSLRPASR